MFRGIASTALLWAGLLVFQATPVRAVPVCLETGENCAIGERGPNGGVIFYDAGAQQWWGRFLEAKIGSERAMGAWGSTTSVYGAGATQALQRRSMAIGMGRENTRLMREAGSPLVLSMFPDDQDWYLPSKDELDALYNYRVQYLGQPNVMWNASPMWSSSESEAGFAWYQLFQDGTQFTDAQGIRPGLATNKNYMSSPVHVGSDFTSLPMNVIRVRAFPAPSSSPTFNFVTSVRENRECTTQAINCLVGDRGPAGGIIVYDAGADMSWGRYLEVAPQSCEVERVAFNSTSSKPALYSTAQERIRAKGIGMGAQNTQFISSKFAGAAKVAADSTCNNYTDWFLPSKDELNEAFRQLSHSRKGLQVTPVGGFDRGYYWTSSDYNGSTAWTQYFADGQQFDRVQTLSANKQSPYRPLRVRPMRAFRSGEVAPAKPTISIVCFRATVSGKPGVSCDGVTSGFAEGSALLVKFRFPGETTYTQGSVRPTTDASGGFTWSRKTGRKLYVYFTSSDGSIESNRAIVAAN